MDNIYGDPQDIKMIAPTHNFVTLPALKKQEQEQAKGLNKFELIEEYKLRIIEEKKSWENSEKGLEIALEIALENKNREEYINAKKALQEARKEHYKIITQLHNDLTAAREAPHQGGGKRKSKGKGKKVSKKPVASQKKQSIYKEILGKQMKIYKMPDSRKEYVKYKGELLHISDYKDLMKQKAIAKTKTKVTKVTKVTQQKAKSKTKK